MKRMWRKTLSLLLAAMMVVSIVSVQPSNAAVEYFHFSDFSTVKTSPTQVNSGTIEIAGTYSGVAAESIQFKVEKIVDDKVVAVTNGTGSAPILEGTNGFRFTNVKLPGDGLNRITVWGTASGNSVSAEAYVYYPNVPTIYDIKLADGRALPADKPILVDTDKMTLLLKAPNSTNVTVQGQSALSGGGDDYLVSNIPLQVGLNKIQIVASNATMTYSVTREVVYYNDRPTAYGVNITSATTPPVSTSLEGNPTVGPNDGTNLSGTISGYLAVEVDPALPPATPSITAVEVKNASGIDVTGSPSAANVTFVENVTVTGATYGFAIYKFTTTGSYTVSASNDYRLYVKGTYGPTTINYPLTFKYRTGTSPIIQEVRQLYNVTEPIATPVLSTSSSLFTDNLVFFQTPIYLSVKALNASSGTITLTTTQGGVVYGVSSPEFEYVNNATPYFTTASGEYVFKITQLPAGEQVLNITVANGAESDTKNIPLTFVPTPFIKLDNTYNTKEYGDWSEFPVLQGQLVNFNLATDQNSIQVTVNGSTKTMDASVIDDVTGKFSYTFDASQRLVDGPNRLTITGLANGVPVSTSITVYLFSKDKPVITQIIPVPVGAADDSSNKFPNSGTLAHTTNEKKMDVLFTVKNAPQGNVSIDGQNYTSWDASTNTYGLLTVVSTSGTSITFRLSNVALPASGTKSVTVTAAKGTATASQTLQVNRIQVPYTILSPKLPEEQVVNQNFIKVSIRAEGADSILLGKEKMVKGTDDIFRLTVDNLKPGNNTIKFAITTGTTESKGQFNIHYAAQNEVGAQLRTPMPSSGKLTAFNGALSISFPKGTLLRNPENKNLINAPQIDLFNDQQLLLGIADKNDGRTIKKYNRVGEFLSGVPQDGTLADISPVGFAVNVLQGSRAQFGYASELYWIDAGYFKGGSTYETVDGMQPYETGSEFYIRGQDPAKWMVPTNRGTITLKYNENIRNEAAKNLSVWHFSNNTWRNLGGTVSTSKKTITAPMDGFGYYAVMSVRFGFDDITGHGYARNQLDTMFAKGIMQPKAGNLFGVYDNITRGEFATMIVRILDLPLNYDTSASLLTFADVPPVSLPGALWDYRYIETAARAGIISGLAPRTFNPGGFLTREQAAVIIARALNYKLGDPDKDRAALTKQFVDGGQIDYYAIPHVQAVVKAKIMSGQVNPAQEGEKPTYSFNPKANLTRADMAIISYNIMTKLKKI